jgi:hypothetical protein
MNDYTTTKSKTQELFVQSRQKHEKNTYKALSYASRE